MKTVCIVQARMGSTRLPGKVMKHLCGKTVLECGIERLKIIDNIDEIIIATTVLEEDDVLEKEAIRLGVGFYRGSSENVLSRYFLAATKANADVVVRVTSDCPLIDFNVTSDIISFFTKNPEQYDYVSNALVRTFPRGLDTEVFSYKALEKAYNEAVLERDKEHVTSFIYTNPEIFKLGSFVSEVDYSDYRWTLDTAEDFQLLKNLYENLFYKYGFNFGIKEILKLYELNPELKSINQYIEQKNI